MNTKHKKLFEGLLFSLGLFAFLSVFFYVFGYFMWQANEPERQRQRDMCHRYHPTTALEQCLWEHERGRSTVIP